MNDITIGQKLRNYRKQAGISQLELEMMIDTSPGSISRIENGEVNPTKETISKIIEVLKISTTDAATLLGIDIYKELVDLINISTDLNNFNIEEIMKTTAIILINKLKLMDLALFVIKGEQLWATSMAKIKQVKFIENILPDAFNNINIPLNDESTKNNILVQSIKERKVKLTYNLYDLGLPILSELTISAIIKLSGFECCLVIPLINNDEVLGVIVFTKNYKDDFSKDREVLMAFARTITKTLINSRNYSNLEEKIKDLENK